MLERLTLNFFSICYLLVNNSTLYGLLYAVEAAVTTLWLVLAALQFSGKWSLQWLHVLLQLPVYSQLNTAWYLHELVYFSEYFRTIFIVYIRTAWCQLSCKRYEFEFIHHTNYMEIQNRLKPVRFCQSNTGSNFATVAHTASFYDRPITLIAAPQ